MIRMTVSKVRAWSAALLLVALALPAAAWPADPHPGNGHRPILPDGTPAPVHFIQHGGSMASSFFNYDGPWYPATDRNAHGSKDPNKRDWPITVIFWHEASKSRIRAALGKSGPLASAGFRMNSGARVFGPYKFVNQQNGEITKGYDSDQGMKNDCNEVGTNIHVRLYSADQHRLYDPSQNGWGHYVVASTHLDHGEHDYPKNTPGRPDPELCEAADPWEGRSEDAAKRLVNKIQTVKTAQGSSNATFGTIEPNVANLDNYLGNLGRQHWEKKNTHRWQSDGYATKVEVLP
ncbi:MAG TPA: hypothetical protein VF520_13480 [Thermoleophilaceae bacterium]|jgi:hypothetical protein